MGWYIIPFIVVLSVVVFFHELGHYLVGRWCGVKIDRFSLGFGPELFAWVDKRGTRWRIAAFPARRLCEISRRRGCLQRAGRERRSPEWTAASAA